MYYYNLERMMETVSDAPIIYRAFSSTQSFELFGLVYTLLGIPHVTLNLYFGIDVWMLIPGTLHYSPLGMT